MGVTLDPGAWPYSREADTAFAGYAGSTFPSPNLRPAALAPLVSWDVSHARRFVGVLETLYRVKPLLGRLQTDFPTDDDMRAFAAQYVYSVFSGNASNPTFSNFWCGQDGWYRVGYHGWGFGYAPSDLTIAGITGGYGFWGEWNSDVVALLPVLQRALTAPAFSAFRQRHFGYFSGMSCDPGTGECSPVRQVLNTTDPVYPLMLLSQWAVHR